MSRGQELEKKLVTDEIRDSADTGLRVVRDADRHQLPPGRARALMLLAEQRLEQAAPIEELAQLLATDMVPEWCDAAVLDLVDEGANATRSAVAVSGAATSLAPMLSEPVADEVTREAAAQVTHSRLAYTGVSWVSPRADESPPDSAEHDGATRWHVYAIPLVARTRLCGVLSMISARRFSPDTMSVVGEYARRVAPALQLARLAELDEGSPESNRSARGLRLLEDVGAIVSEGSDEVAVMRKVAERLVMDTADYCAIELHEATGAVRLDVARYAAGLSALPPGRLKALQAAAADSGQEAEARVGMNRSITVPIAAHGVMEGTITLVSIRRGVDYGTHELALVRDIAARLAGVVERHRLRRSSQLALLAKSEFLSVMSHELRTPLTAILGYTALLREGFGGRLTTVQARHLAGIENSGVHMVSMIDDILSFVGMEAGWDVVAPTVVSVTEVVNDVLLPARQVARRKGLNVSAELGELPRLLRMDGAKVRRLLGNLLSNAVKFTENGAVEFRVDYKPGMLVFTVSDSGSGMTAAQRGQIFEPFWQAEPATTRRAGGIGLGLSVARRIATLLGGSLEVDDGIGDGSGSVFTARIPVEEFEGAGVGSDGAVTRG